MIAIRTRRSVSFSPLSRFGERGEQTRSTGHGSNEPQRLVSDGSKREQGKAFQNVDGVEFLIDVGMSDAINDSKGAILHIHTG